MRIDSKNQEINKRKLVWEEKTHGVQLKQTETMRGNIENSSKRQFDMHKNVNHFKCNEIAGIDA